MRSHVQKIGQRYAALTNDYFITLFNGGFQKQDFVETQVQFELAVTHFVSPMQTLSKKILDADARSGIADNIADELGGGVQKESHSATFRSFLERLDATAIDILAQREVWPEVVTFNTLLDDACGDDQIWRGAAVMGMVEYMFATISGLVAHGVVSRGWLTESDMVHYALHQELDEQHAEDFFLLLEPGWHRSLVIQEIIVAGFEEGAAGFFDLYDGLFQARQRRWRRNVRS